MLTDSQMQRLAERCGFTYSHDGRNHYYQFNGDVVAYAGQLNPAGYFTVIKVLNLEIDSDKDGRNIYAEGHGGEEGIFGHAGSGETLEAAIDAALEEIL